MPMEDFEESRYEFHKEMEEDFFAAFKIAGLQKYRIKPGDTIWNLSRNQFELPLWLMKKYNANLELGRLPLHYEMVVPVVEEKS
jgi:membrane-bound lytic murein transglycosylase D